MQPENWCLISEWWYRSHDTKTARFRSPVTEVRLPVDQVAACVWSFLKAVSWNSHWHGENNRSTNTTTTIQPCYHQLISVSFISYFFHLPEPHSPTSWLRWIYVRAWRVALVFTETDRQLDSSFITRLCKNQIWDQKKVSIKDLISNFTQTTALLSTYTVGINCARNNESNYAAKQSRSSNKPLFYFYPKMKIVSSAARLCVWFFFF